MKKSRAFTLVEVLVCLAIAAGLLALLFISLSKSRQNTQVRLQGQMLVSDLRLARSLATTEGTALVDFTTSGSYLVKDSSGRARKKTEIYPGVSIAFPSGSLVYTFNAAGAADHGGTFLVSAAGASRSYTVELTDATGMITGRGR